MSIFKLADEPDDTHPPTSFIVIEDNARVVEALAEVDAHIATHGEPPGSIEDGSTASAASTIAFLRNHIESGRERVYLSVNGIKSVAAWLKVAEQPE
jgi:hypothetical protein